MWTSPQFPADLITFTEKILNGKLIFCAVELPTIIDMMVQYLLNMK